MRLQPGDRVAVIDSTDEGIIIAVRKDQADIEDIDGFIRTYPLRELVRISEELKDLPPPGAIPKTSQKIIKRKPSREIILDLHFKGKAVNTPIIEEQISHFYRELNKALQTGKLKMIVIHGIGEGKLKQRLAKELNRQKINFLDAPYHRFGYGALEINLSILPKKYYPYKK